jgi:hypothetical protein
VQAIKPLFDPPACGHSGNERKSQTIAESDPVSENTGLIFDKYAYSQEVRIKQYGIIQGSFTA